MNTPCPKVIVIGLDGATFNVIDPWLKKGKLPVLQSLINNGISGQLKSTIPPMSPVAWPSFYTGVNPGSHGIFDFFKPKREIPFKVLMNSGLNCNATPFWKYFDKAGYKVGIVNVPMTFPPDKLTNGFIISGLDTPDIENDFTWPPDLKDKISKNVGKYIIEVRHTPETTSDPDKYLELIFEAIDIREKTALYLLDNYALDVFTIIFTSTDRAQHTLWKYMDPRHSRYVPGYENHILKIFQRIDKALGRILEKTGKQGDIIIMSDHGFESVEKTVDLNEWLRKNGYQTLKKIYPVDILKFYIRDIYKRISKKIFHSSFDSNNSNWQIEELIDWDKTQAYYVGAWGCIFINLAGREPYGIVQPGKEYDELIEELKKKLSTLTDPENNNPVIKSIHKRDEIYTGGFIKDSPELIIMWNKNYNGAKTVFDRARNILQSKKIIAKSKNFSGDHERNGIFVFHSPNGKINEKIENAEIIDICPTLFYLLGEKVPAIFHGRVLTEIFNEDYLSLHPVQYTEEDNFKTSDKEMELSNEDTDLILDRLKDLGYVE